MWTDEVLNVLQVYRAEVGSFAKIGTATWDRNKRLRVLFWYACREDFQLETSPGLIDNHGKAMRRCFLFTMGKSFRGQSLAAFFDKIERRLDIGPGTKFGPTMKKGVIWFRPSPWWQANNVRRSLFTALMRAGCYYRPTVDNFDEALNSRTYTRTTRKAIDHFLAGHTACPLRPFPGWQTTFEMKTDDDIRRSLVKPKGKIHVARE